MEELLRLSHISASGHEGVHLNDFNMTVFSGEFVFMAGAYHSGKQLVARILTGSLPPESGSISIDQKTLTNYTEKDASDFGVFYIDSIFPLADTLTVHENIFLLRKKRAKKFLYNHKASIAEARLLLKEVSFSCNPMEKIYNLSIFQRLLVCIAKALSWDTRLLIINLTYMDLTPNDLDHLSRILAEQKARGMSCLIIDNFYNPLASLADSAIIVSHGSDIKTIRHQTVTRELMESYLLPVFPKNRSPSSDRQADDSSIQLSLSNSRQTFATWTPGKIIGIIDHYPDLSTSFYDYVNCFCQKNQAVFTHATIQQACAPDSLTFYWIPENSDSCLLENLSIADNLLMPRYPRLSGICGYIKEELKQYCEEDFRALLRLPSLPPLKDLSQLQKRILSIDRFALPGTDVLFIDSPFMNLDFGGQSYMYQFLLSLSKKGIAVFISSRQADILYNFCTDIIVCDQFTWIETVTRTPSSELEPDRP